MCVTFYQNFMNIIEKFGITATLCAALLVACGGAKSNAKGEEKEVENQPTTTYATLYDYRVVAEYPHSADSYTQGLEWVDGTMWEGTGQEGESYLQLLDLNSGAVERIASLPDDEFGEGITHFGDRIYQLTWTSRKAYVYDLEGRLLKTIRYNGEGWGITTDGKRLFLSDGSSTIREIDPETFATKRSILVSFNGQPLDYINELEWANGKIWANVYLTSAIVEINPTTGIVEGYVDLPELRSRLKDNPEAEAFNGVAYNPTTSRFYVTGKDWNKIFEIEIVK